VAGGCVVVGALVPGVAEGGCVVGAGLASSVVDLLDMGEDAAGASVVFFSV